VINKNQRTPLAPNCFAFGGSTKPISEIMFNKYDKDKNGMLKKSQIYFYFK
jgi:hypothetical protein